MREQVNWKISEESIQKKQNKTKQKDEKYRREIKTNIGYI